MWRAGWGAVGPAIVSGMGEEAADVFGAGAAGAGGEGFDLRDEVGSQVDADVGGAEGEEVGGHGCIFGWLFLLRLT